MEWFLCKLPIGCFTELAFSYFVIMKIELLSVVLGNKEGWRVEYILRQIPHSGCDPLLKPCLLKNHLLSHFGCIFWSFLFYICETRMCRILKMRQHSEEYLTGKGVFHLWPNDIQTLLLTHSAKTLFWVHFDSISLSATKCFFS